MTHQRIVLLALLLPLPLACGGRSHPSSPQAAANEHEPEPEHEHEHEHAHPAGPLVHRFQDAARWASEFDDPGRDEWQRPADVVRLLDLPAGATVADLGAGTGYFEKWLSRAVGPAGRVMALDIEESMVRWLRDRARREGLGNVEARVVPVDDPGLAPGSVQAILIVDTWHHIPERVAYAGKLLAALLPGGRVAVVDFAADSPRGPPPEHRLSPETVVRELEAAGFAASIAQEPLPDQYVVLGERPR